MKNKKGLILSLLLIMSMICSYFIYPKNFATDGGSCYQGITLMIHRMFLIICGSTTILSLVILFFKPKLSLILSIVSTVIWLLWCFGAIVDSFISLIYLFPVLFLSILNIVSMIKYNRSEQHNSNEL